MLEALRRAVPPLRIHVDNQEVVDGYHRGRQWCYDASRSGASLWKLIWPLLDDLGDEVVIVKVKGHATEADIATGRISPIDFIGNHRADEAARDGSQAAEKLSPTGAANGVFVRALRWYQWAAAYAANWTADSAADASHDGHACSAGVEPSGPAPRRRRAGIMEHIRWLRPRGGQVCRRCGREGDTEGRIKDLRNSPCLGSPAGRVLSRSGIDSVALMRRCALGYLALWDTGARPIDCDVPPVALQEDAGMGDAENDSESERSDQARDDVDDGGVRHVEDVALDLDAGLPGDGYGYDGEAAGPRDVQLVASAAGSVSTAFAHEYGHQDGTSASSSFPPPTSSGALTRPSNDAPTYEPRGSKRSAEEAELEPPPPSTGAPPRINTNSGYDDGEAENISEDSDAAAFIVHSGSTAMCDSAKRPLYHATDESGDHSEGSPELRQRSSASGAGGVPRRRLTAKRPPVPAAEQCPLPASSVAAPVPTARPHGRVEGPWGHGHRIDVRGRYIWCRACGRYATRRVGVGLSSPCQGEATGAYFTRLARLNNGRHPITGEPI